MLPILTLLITFVTGVLYFVLDLPYWSLGSLFFLTLLTRFRSKTVHLGKYLEILLFFYFISYSIESFGVKYPGSLIIVLTFLILVIFYEGPEWSQLYFSAGKTASNMKLALFVAVIFVFMFGIAIYSGLPGIKNPVPIHAPIDAIIVMGIGFAFYLPIMEEIIFRSIIYQRAERASGDGNYAVFIQGLLYGLMAYKVGVPAGITGAILGGLFGVSLGYLVKRSNSIYLSMLAHFIVTFGVFTTLAVLGKV
ncbi:MAG: CPBP family intramembrane glutamic endopeptidase [bacterium]